jgi:hypothetical protein
MPEMPVARTDRMVRGAGVRAEGIRSAKAASICARSKDGEGISVFALYSPITVGTCQSVACTINAAIIGKLLILSKLIKTNSRQIL